MVEPTFMVVKTEKQRSHQRAPFQVAESSHHAVGGLLFFDLLHAGALAALVWKVTALGDNSVQPDAHVKPLSRYR